jgi:hypothetical protein
MIAAGYSPEWLALREGADAEARAADLLDPLRDALGGPGPLVVRDLGCGTGSMGRWLAPLLPGPQHWVLQDRDDGLLAHAARSMPTAAADGAPVTVRTRRGDVAALSAADLAGTGLVTASALLDLLTADEVGRLAAVVSAAGAPALLTLSVAGRVAIEPAEPFDAEIAAAFDAHQRRVVAGRRLLGPDAVAVTADAFARLGAAVTVRPSPWKLGPDRSALAAAWLRGWIGVAVQERPDLVGEAEGYLSRRLAAAAAHGLSVTVAHDDVLAVPR